MKFKKCSMFLLILVFGSFLFAGCDGTSNLVQKHMSDIRINYFLGSCDNFVVDFSCGYREKNFAYDGVSTELVECGVLGLAFNSTYSYSKIVVNVDIDGQISEIVLERSPFENKYMADIEKIIEKPFKVALKNSGEYVTLTKLSKDFGVDYEKALKIGATYFQKQLDELYFNGDLNCECYLKIVSKKDFDKTYWFFSYIDRSKKGASVLIDVNTGEVLVHKQK